MEKNQGFSTDFVTVGKINQPWGINGHVKVTPLTDNPERLIAGASVYIDSELTKILDVQSPHGYPIIRFSGYEDRQSAEVLLGKLISIENNLQAHSHQHFPYPHSEHPLGPVTLRSLNKSQI